MATSPNSCNGNCNIALFLQNLEGGGAERSIVALANEIASRGYAIDLVVGDAGSDYRDEVSSQVNLIDFATNSPLLQFSNLSRYLRRRNPTVVMSALDLANIMLLVAARFSLYRGRKVISQRAVVDASLRELGFMRRQLTRILMRFLFPGAHALISNSHAAASEVSALLEVPAERIFTINNAVDLERIDRLAREPLPSGLAADDKNALIVSVGSLSKRKDMETLIRAIAIARAERAVKLVILGKGPEQQRLESVIGELDLSEHVHLLGFDPNPYKWIAAARVFVSASTGEGFPNVITEALAAGPAIVATDCPGDTSWLLGQGKWGRLVPVGDAERMAQAILAALDDADPSSRRSRAAEFSPSRITSAYLKVLLPGQEHPAHFRH
ncbi:MAG: glycosyltransferase [Gammaproteobacteria bacterium]|nr:glycosyltransferase [Gammaproteobacteria bacterium]